MRGQIGSEGYGGKRAQLLANYRVVVAAVFVVDEGLKLSHRRGVDRCFVVGVCPGFVGAGQRSGVPGDE